MVEQRVLRQWQPCSHANVTKGQQKNKVWREEVAEGSVNLAWKSWKRMNSSVARRQWAGWWKPPRCKRWTENKKKKKKLSLLLLFSYWSLGRSQVLLSSSDTDSCRYVGSTKYNSSRSTRAVCWLRCRVEEDRKTSQRPCPWDGHLLAEASAFQARSHTSGAFCNFPGNSPVSSSLLLNLCVIGVEFFQLPGRGIFILQFTILKRARQGGIQVKPVSVYCLIPLWEILHLRWLCLSFTFSLPACLSQLQ